MQLKPPPALAFVHGPSTADATSLRKWLEQQASTVRLPVLVKLSNPPTTVASAELITGRTSNSVRSLQFAIHSFKSCGLGDSMTW